MLKHVAVWIFSFTTLISFIDTYQRVVWEYTLGLNILGHVIAFTGVICMTFFHVKWYHDVTPKNPYTLDLDLMIKLEEENQLKRDKEASDAKDAKMDKKLDKKLDKILDKNINDLAKRSICFGKLKIIGPCLNNSQYSAPERNYSLDEKENTPGQQPQIQQLTVLPKVELLKIKEEIGMESGSTMSLSKTPVNTLFVRGMSLSPTGIPSLQHRPSTDSIKETKSRDQIFPNYLGKVFFSKI
jgi:hypothetical protein